MIVNFFDDLYSSIQNRNKVLALLRVYSILRFTVRWAANFFISTYYLITFKWGPAVAPPDSVLGSQIVISLTSFPSRLNHLWIVIESLLRQSHPANRIILWLSNEQVNCIEDLPYLLRCQTRRGLEIRLCADDLKSHKKYWYALQEFPDDSIITVDDDIIYPTFLVDRLVELNKTYPAAICCHRALRLKYADGKLAEYADWPILKRSHQPSLALFQTSGGGTLYPANSLHHCVLDVSTFKKICFHADDIWLNAASQLNNTPIVKSDYFSECLPVVYFSKKTTLSSLNNDLKLNDIQLTDVRSHFISALSVDPFEDRSNFTF